MKSQAIEKEDGIEDRTSDTQEKNDNTRLDESESKSDSDSKSTYSLREELNVPRRQPSRVLSRTVSEVRDGIETRRDLDLEEGQAPEEEKAAIATTVTPDPSDPNLVTWEGPEDPENPKNWAFSKKWAAVFIVSVFTLVSPVSSSMVAPSLTTIGEELDIPTGCKSGTILLRSV